MLNKILLSFCFLLSFMSLNIRLDLVDVGVNPRPRAMEVDSGEKRLNELGYKQELRREMVHIWYFGYMSFIYKCI